MDVSFGTLVVDIRCRRDVTATPHSLDALESASSIVDYARPDVALVMVAGIVLLILLVNSSPVSILAVVHRVRKPAIENTARALQAARTKFSADDDHYFRQGIRDRSWWLCVPAQP